MNSVGHTIGDVVQVPTIFFQKGMSFSGGVLQNGRSEQNQESTAWKYLGNHTWKYKKVKATELADGSFELKMRPKVSKTVTIKNKITSHIGSSDIANGHYARIGKCAVDLLALKTSIKKDIEGENRVIDDLLDAGLSENDLLMAMMDSGYGRYVSDEEQRQRALEQFENPQPDPEVQAGLEFMQHLDELMDNGSAVKRRLTDAEVEKYELERGLEHVSSDQIRAENYKIDFRADGTV